MKIEKVSYQKTYSIGPYLTDRIGFEACPDEPKLTKEKGWVQETHEDVLSKLEKMADDWHRKSHPYLYQDIMPLPAQRITSPVVNVIDKSIERLEIQIDNANTLEELDKILLSYDKLPGEIIEQIEEKKNQLVSYEK